MTEPSPGPLPPLLTVRVPGVPQPQGSIRSLGKGRPSVHSNADRLLPWRGSVIAHLQVAARADQVQPGWPLLEAVAVHLEFVFQRPKSAPRRPFPHVKPDVDKLTRAVLDCLGVKGAGVIGDDAQVVDVTARKRYGPLPCVQITVTAMDPEDP